MGTNQMQKNIPDEWSMVSIGDVFTFVKSYAFSRENLLNNTSNDEGIGNIHYGDIHSTYNSTSIDLNNVSVPMVKDSDFQPVKEDLLREGDLIMADASEDYEGVGVTVSIHGLGNKKIVGGLHTFVLRDAKNMTDKYFRQYLFRNPSVRNTLQKIANGVSVYGISKTALSKVQLPVPPLEEQRRIVGVLEVWDEATRKLARKIEVKKKIKKGLMQQLLTGKKRLPGFSDEWQTVKLGEIAAISRGGSPRPIEAYITTSRNGHNWLRIGDINIDDKYIFTTKEKIIKEGLSKTTLVNPGDFILSNSMSFGRPYIMKTTACIHDGWLALKNIASSINKEFLFYLLLSKKIQNLFISLAAGSGVQNLKKETVSLAQVCIPGIEEQNAIANVLTTADNEISELEKKLSLFKQQKKFLLNKLVSGEIRVSETICIDPRVKPEDDKKGIEMAGKASLC